MDVKVKRNMEKDQLDGLLALKVVTEKRNFTATAEQLGISASAISQIIKQLNRLVYVLQIALRNRNTGLLLEILY
jgi:DNA-binding transcriptional LysR family regulator